MRAQVSNQLHLMSKRATKIRCRSISLLILLLKSEKQNKNKMKFAINLNSQCIMMISIKNSRNYNFKLMFSLEEAYSIFFRSDIKETHFIDFYNIDYSS